MTDLRTLVAAVDFSSGSATALHLAADLARRAGAALHILHADALFHASGEGRPHPGGAGGSLHDRVRQFAWDTLGANFQALTPTITVVRDVNATAALLRATAAVDADLLVLGTHGRTGVARFFMGSVAEACVAAAPCPVLTVPRRTSNVVPSSSAPVLVAVDFSDRSRDALAAGAEMAAAFGAPLEVVHVVPDAGPYPGLSPNIVDLAAFDPPRGKAVQDRLVRFAAGITPEPTVTHAALGSPARLIASLASERGAGALVMGTNGRTGLAHAFVGSVAEAALRRSPCPVLSLRAPGRIAAQAAHPITALAS